MFEDIWIVIPAYEEERKDIIREEAEEIEELSKEVESLRSDLDKLRATLAEKGVPAEKE